LVHSLRNTRPRLRELLPKATVIGALADPNFLTTAGQLKDLRSPSRFVSVAVRWYVSSPEYQRRLLHGAWRVDLNGRPAGTVSQEDEAHARAQLAAIEAKRAGCASGSSDSAPALNLAERMKQTSQAEQLNVPPAARLPPKSTPPPAPAKPLTLKDVRGKRLAEHAEQQPKPRGQIRAWRAP